MIRNVRYFYFSLTTGFELTKKEAKGKLNKWEIRNLFTVACYLAFRVASMLRNLQTVLFVSAFVHNCKLSVVSSP